MKRATTVDEYIGYHTQWKGELTILRKLLKSTELKESVKWGAPCYSINAKNVVGLAAFKNHLALWFFQGALLNDRQKTLVNAQEGVTKALRQWRFEHGDKLDLKLIKEYVVEAIKNQQAGKEIKPAKKKPIIIPEELTGAFKQNSKLKTFFN